MSLASLRVRNGLVALALAAAGPLAAQAPASSPAPVAPPAPVIREILILPDNIFDSTELYSPIYRGMNKLHFTTKPYVVRQQLLFAVGQRWDSTLVNETARNLRSLSIFTSVVIDSIPTDSGVIARVRTRDAWAFGIVFSINTSGSQVGYAFGFNDRNVLGSGTQLQFQYGQNPTRDSVLVGVTRRMLFGSNYDLGVLLSRLSDGNNDTVSFGLPFRTIESPKGWTLAAKVNNGRILQFYGGDPVAGDTLRRAFQLVSLNPAVAIHSTDERYVRLGLYAQVERNDFQPYDLPASDMSKTYTAAFGPYLALGHPKFHHIEFYQAGGRVEDLQLGYTATLGLYFTPAGWGYGANGLAPSISLSAGQGTPHGFLLETLSASSVFNTNGLDSGSVNAGVTAAWFPSARQLLIAYAGVGAQKNGYPGEEYELGFGYAVRAYPQYAYTGNRMFITAAEYRVIIWPDIYKLVAAGFGVFVDHAGAWYTGSPQRTGTDVGAGLRFGSRKGTGAILMRADIAYRWANDVVPAGWVFTFGKGFVWQQF